MNQVKRYLNTAVVYAVTAMACGVFYREFTKNLGFTGDTNLSVMHTHYFLLGMVFFLLLALMEKSFSFSGQKGIGKIAAAYHIGLNLTGVMLFTRGLLQALRSEISGGLDAAVSGLAGLGHILLGICIILFLLRLRKAAEGTN